MGKQINFYMDEVIEIEFIKLIINEGFILLYTDLEQRKLLSIESVEQFGGRVNRFYLYKGELGNIVNDKFRSFDIDTLRSPVIEFSRTIVNSEEKKITRGRIWVETRYYGDNDGLVAKNPLLEKEFNKLVKWIKKNIPYQDTIQGDYILKDYISNNLKELNTIGYRLM